MTHGPTPSGCIDLLRIRPLLVGAAWKVIDLLLEQALALSPFMPDQAHGWSIEKKLGHARESDARPSGIALTAWRALMKTYVETAQLRHSLVHRRVHTDAAHALVGVDRTGAPLRPFSAEEQEALARTALRAAELVTSTAGDVRVAADPDRQLGLLRGVHGEALPMVGMADSLPEITVIVDANDSGLYPFDVPALWARQPFKESTHADLVVRFRDRSGQDLRGRLEDAPDEVVVLDPDKPPGWLT